jgi:hypothetical protein
VPLENVGERVPDEIVSADRLASLDFVYVNLLAELADEEPEALTKKMSI